MVGVFICLLALWIGCMMWSGLITENKGRGFIFGFVLGLIFGVVGLLLSALIPRAPKKVTQHECCNNGNKATKEAK